MNYLIQTGDFGMPLEKSHVFASQNSGKCEYMLIDDITAENALGKVPVGSVEFCAKVMSALEITPPPHITYPDELKKYLKRDIRVANFCDALDSEFVKPYSEIKAFTGAIKSELEEVVAGDFKVFVSDPVAIVAEFRVYVSSGKIIGHSRYDDGDSEQEQLSTLEHEEVKRMIADYDTDNVGYSIDVAILNNANLVLIEVNDGWALGWYQWGDCSFPDYLEMITNRWVQIAKEQSEKEVE